MMSFVVHQSLGAASGPSSVEEGAASTNRGDYPVAESSKSETSGASEKGGWKFLRDKKPNLVAQEGASPSIPALAVQVKRLAVLEVKIAARLRRKCFAHHDCVSVLSNLADASGVSRKDFSVNLKSGASAITESSEEEGDGKSNALVSSTARFRNEIGDEPSKFGELKTVGAGGRLLFAPAACVGILMEDYDIMAMDADDRDRYRYAQLTLCRPQGGHQSKDKQLSRYNHMDLGVLYYRVFFVDYEHQNFFGVDEGLGPIAVSIRREVLAGKAAAGTEDDSSAAANSSGKTIYRVIVRTAHPNVLRGSVSEESVLLSCGKQKSSTSSSSITPKDIISFVAPELQLASLRFGVTSTKASDQLLKLDESSLSKHYKIGVMYCTAGQSTEEEMYNNDTASQQFHNFMSSVSTKVALKGFTSYRAQLDNKSDTTGTHSYYTRFEGCEVMFHVSALLPTTPNNRQQLLRKRHIGNDIVTVIFQEKGSKPFTPATIRSHFQHVFVIVQCIDPCPNTGQARYQVATSQAQDIPIFGPAIPDGGIFVQGEEFREFLLAKLINAECASRDCTKFLNMSQRTRFEYLSDLAESYATQQSVDSADSGGLYGKLARIRKRPEKVDEKQPGPLISTGDLQSTPGALMWIVRVNDWGIGEENHKAECLLCVSLNQVCLVDEDMQLVRMQIPTDSIIGWLVNRSSLTIYYGHGAYFVINCNVEDQGEGSIYEIRSRLLAASPNGCEATAIRLQRNSGGHLGFMIHRGGIVGQVDENGVAYTAGIRQGSRIAEMDGIPLYGRLHYYVVGHLKKSTTIDAVVIAPHKDGSPRGGKNTQTSDSIRHKSVILRRSKHPARSLSSRTPNRPRLCAAIPGERRAQPSVVNLSDKDGEEFRHMARKAKLALVDSCAGDLELFQGDRPNTQ